MINAGLFLSNSGIERRNYEKIIYSAPCLSAAAWWLQ